LILHLILILILILILNLILILILILNLHHLVFALNQMKTTPNYHQQHSIQIQEYCYCFAEVHCRMY